MIAGRIKWGWIGLLLIFGGIACESSFAEQYPTRSIRNIVPFPPGATTDAVGRLMARELGKRLGQTVVVDNRGGAGGGLGTRIGAQAAANGYTLITTTNAVMTIVPQISDAGFDPFKDLVPVAFAGEAYSVLAVSPSLPVKSVGDLVAYAKRNPGKLNYGSAGVGSMAHIQMELLKMKTGIEIVHVPFQGGGPAIGAAIAGEVQAVFDLASFPHVESGRLRGLAVNGSDRWVGLPALPTMREAGVKEWNFSLWYALLAPAKTPEHVVKLISRHWADAMDDPQVNKQLRDLGLRPIKETPEMTAQRIRTDYKNMTELLKAANIRKE